MRWTLSHYFEHVLVIVFLLLTVGVLVVLTRVAPVYIAGLPCSRGLWRVEGLGLLSKMDVCLSIQRVYETSALCDSG